VRGALRPALLTLLRFSNRLPAVLLRMAMAVRRSARALIAQIMFVVEIIAPPFILVGGWPRVVAAASFVMLMVAAGARAVMCAGRHPSHWELRLLQRVDERALHCVHGRGIRQARGALCALKSAAFRR
jgi:hypothetical protein